MKIEASGERRSGDPILDALIDTCREQIDGFLGNVEWRRFMGSNFLGSEKKTVTLADGSATTEIDWSIEELRERLIKGTL